MRSKIEGFVARNSGWLVAVLAIAGLVVAVGILVVGPPLLPADIVDRAPISSAIGGLFALLTAIVGISAAIWINTADFKAEQQVKADTAQLRASLRMILIKGALLTTDWGRSPVHEDFAKELEVVGAFARSTTALGFWTFVDRRSGEAGTKSEDWRIFFPYCANLVDAGSATPIRASQVYHASAWLEQTLANLDSRDINAVGRNLANLSDVLGSAETSEDSLLSGMVHVYGKGSKFDPLAAPKGSKEH